LVTNFQASRWSKLTIHFILRNVKINVKMKKLKNFSLIIIIVGLLLLASTLGAWYVTKSLAEKETARLFNDEVNIVESWITNRFEFYKTIVFGLQAYWAGNEVVTKEEWQVYASTLKIKERFPGITSISFVKRVDDNYIVTFVYPPEREAALGVNLITQPGRLEVINKAIETASPAITDKIFLVADQKPGFVMYAPIYKKGFLEGLVAIAFRSEQVFKDLFDARDTFPHLDFELYKGTILEDEYILYDHDHAFYIRKGEDRKRLETKRLMTTNGETFTLLVAPKPSFGLKTLEKQLPNIVLIFGLVFCFLFFLFAFSEFRKLEKKEKKWKDLN